MADKGRSLVLRRDERGQICLHDDETGQVLSGQSRVVIEQGPGEVTKVKVEFIAAKARGAVRIEVDDG